MIPDKDVAISRLHSLFYSAADAYAHVMIDGPRVPWSGPALESWAELVGLEIERDRCEGTSVDPRPYITLRVIGRGGCSMGYVIAVIAAEYLGEVR